MDAASRAMASRRLPMPGVARADLAAVLAVATALAAASVRGDERSTPWPGAEEWERFRAEFADVRKEIAAEELALDRLYARFPGQLGPDLEAALQGLSRDSGLGPLEAVRTEAGERLPLADGRPAPLRRHDVLVSGRGPFAALLRFLRGAGRFLATSDLLGLDVKAAPAETVHFEARIDVLLFEPLERPASVRGLSPEGLLAESRAELAELKLRRALLEGLVESRGTHTVLPAVEAYSAALEDESIALSELRYDGSIVLRGVAIGEAARAALAEGASAAGLSRPRVELSSSGACSTFTVTARPGGVAGHEVVVLGNGPFGDGVEAACRRERPRAGSSVRRSGSGDVTLRFRDVDVPGLARVLHEVAGLDLVVDSDVTGLLDVDVVGATPEEALEAIRAAGVVAGPPPVRRLSRADRPPGPVKEDAWTGDPASLLLTGADLRSILGVFDVAFSLPVRMPKGLTAEVSVFVTEQPWDLLFARIVEAAGLEWSIAGGSAFVGPVSGREDAGATAREAWGPPEPPSARRLAAPPPERLGVRDLTFAGAAGRGGVWTAWAHGPTGRLVRLEPGLKLFDGTVETAGEKGARLRTRSGAAFDLAPAP
jgi:hypothetical protein